MLKLYFGSVPSILSTVLFVVFCGLLGMVLSRRAEIGNWGTLVLAVLLLGVFMSFMSGMKDGVGTPSGVIPVGHWGFWSLSILGGLAILMGIVALIARRQDIMQFSFFFICAVVLAKTLLTEGLRIAALLRHVVQ